MAHLNIVSSFSRMRGLQFRRRGGCFDAARPSRGAVRTSGRPLEPTLHVTAVLRVQSFETEELPAIPAGTRDGLRDDRERTVLFAIPREAVLQRDNSVRLAMPCPHQLGPGLDAPTYHAGVERARSCRRSNVVKAVLGG